MYFVFQTLLVLGLMAACMGIDLASARSQRKKILLVITVGVVCKALIVATVLYVVGVGKLSWLLALIVTQIDPISVGYLGGGQLSTHAYTLLSFWANFDDPITVLLFQYTALPLAGVVSANNILFTYILTAGLALGAYILRDSKKSIQSIYTIVVALSGVFLGTTLAVGLSALFVRPIEGKYIDQAITYIYWIVGVLFVGLCVIYRPFFSREVVKIGIILGIVIHLAHALMTYTLFASDAGRDRTIIAGSQQNGLTSMILAMTGAGLIGIQYRYIPIIPITAIALIVINSIYMVYRKYI